MAIDRLPDFSFREDASAYRSGSQRARIWTEGWLAEWGYCPACGASGLHRTRNNERARDFFCNVCGEDYELKASKSAFGPRVTDGAYRTMMERLLSLQNPNLLLMRYDGTARSVIDLVAIPKQFFVPGIIQERKPLGPHARRAGWIGCNILIGQVPSAGRIDLVRNSSVVPKQQVVESWTKVRFMRDGSPDSRSWLTAVLACVEQIGQSEFALNDVYAFEGKLTALFPSNNNVRPKIRQQLQVLRDQGLIRFLGQGRYRIVTSAPA